MRLALLWALGLLGAGSPLSSRTLPDRGGPVEEQTRPERTLGGHSEPQIFQDSPTLSLAEMLQTNLPEALRVRLELDGESQTLELLQNREPVPGRPHLTWHEPDGARGVSEGHTLESCCYQGAVRGHVGSWASVCTCSGLRGLVVLSPERSYTLELGPGDLRGAPIVSRTRDLLLPGRTCGSSWHASVATRAPRERPRGRRHSHMRSRRRRRDVVAETKVIELVLVADHSEVQRYPDSQYLLTRMLKVAFLLDTFFRPLNVRVALVGLEAWRQRDLVEISRDPGLTLHNFLRWRREDLLPRLPHDSAQLVTATSFSGPAVGMAVQNSICSPDFSGGVNMDHSTSVLGVASSIAHELGHSLGLDHDLPGNSCPCPGPAPAKSCIMEASTDFLPGLNFSNCSRRALEEALLEGMGSCLFEQQPGLPSMAAVCGNMLVEPGEQCDCGFPDECTDPCCDDFTCQLRPGAQCASGGLCCQDCQLRPASWQCRPARGDCDLAEFCSGDSPQCPPDVSLGDGEPCAGGQAVCVQGRCASYAQQCQALWGPGAQPAAPRCLLTANTRGDAFGSCGRSPDGSYVSCAPKDAMCGQLQCQGGRARPLRGSARDLHWEILEANGTQPELNCSWVHLDLGNDVAQPLLTLPGTACGPDLVCIDRRCQPVGLLRAQECRSKCHGHGVCDSKGHCRCEEGWAPPDCANRSRATSSLTIGLPLSLLLLVALMLLGASYWHRARLRQRLCQLKGPSCQYRAAQSGPPERPGPPQRVLLMPGAKAQKQSPACSGEGQSPRGGSAELSELAKLVALRAGQCSWLPGSPFQAAAS
ncbi:disintegrin and metalloproteinase domain-containing protein 15 isoform X14 [Prionailurus bengalensis]|uniref:disintegrin and metalloproteinase domain-containing protein 15 isoform X14 n=1 Tax=Prionailurus bengalensis TaxID=37029 RepID=UPI001CA9919A|nr:disintegrin and metalloproteinase domain-containing protein 15 isoform X14 [Prionailurus bengalensis]XP_043424976.1 disintegrin and metalloproteinase domain-containing protein 15 isoform X14 [Prionailurus bengalensis]